MNSTDNPEPGPRPRASILAPVFYPAAILMAVLVAMSFVMPVGTEVMFSAAQDWVAQEAGWFTILAVAAFLVFIVGLAVSGLGRIRLGPDHSAPDYSYSTWFAMLFAAGMGIGLMYFGVAEPVMHYVDPPVGDAMTVASARQSMRITFFHWGIHAWAIYAVVALSLAYFAFRHGLPLRIRSALYPLIGDRIHGPIGHAVDTFAVLGTMFGLATSLGFGVLQINAGLNYLLGIEISVMVQVILIIVITLIATGSVVSGLDKGIRRLSELNMLLAVALMVFVLLAGPTVHLLQMIVQNTGMYVSNLFSMTFNLYAYEPTGWLGGWTLFYWGWWISWSPFVGMFIARISRGRTVREFVTGVLLVPLGFTFIWMTVYGNTALHMIALEGVTDLADVVAADSSLALFRFLEELPLTAVTSTVATLAVVIFFVTSSDSGSLVIDMLTSEGEEESPVWQRIFWALLEGVVAIALLIAGGLGALQAATLASALPFTVVMLLMCWGLLRALRLDRVKQASLRNARALPQSPGGEVDWRGRLRTIVRQPGRAEVQAFIEEVAGPALEQVAGELGRQGVQARVEPRTGAEGDANAPDGVELRSAHGEEMDFVYAVMPREYVAPGFVLEHPRRRRRLGGECYRAEVHLREGGQGYDLMGWQREEVINDVLDQYQRHLHFLDVVR